MTGSEDYDLEVLAQLLQAVHCVLPDVDAGLDLGVVWENNLD